MLSGVFQFFDVFFRVYETRPAGYINLVFIEQAGGRQNGYVIVVGSQMRAVHRVLKISDQGIGERVGSRVNQPA